MAVLQSAALHNIGRMTPYNIATTVWALSKLLRTADSIPADQQAAERVRLPAPASTSQYQRQSGAHACGSQLAARPHAAVIPPAGCCWLRELGQRRRRIQQLRGPRRRLQLGGVAAARQVTRSSRLSCRREPADGWAGGCHMPAVPGRFKPAHVGDALWGFGLPTCLTRRWRSVRPAVSGGCGTQHAASKRRLRARRPR